MPCTIAEPLGRLQAATAVSSLVSWVRGRIPTCGAGSSEGQLRARLRPRLLARFLWSQRPGPWLVLKLYTPVAEASLPQVVHRRTILRTLFCGPLGDTEIGTGRSILAVHVSAHKRSDRRLVSGTESRHARMASRTDTIMLLTDVGRHCTRETEAKEHARDSGQSLLGRTALDCSNFVVRARRPDSRPGSLPAALKGRGSLGGSSTRLRRGNASTVALCFGRCTFASEAPALGVLEVTGPDTARRINGSCCALQHSRAERCMDKWRPRFAKNAKALWRRLIRSRSGRAGGKSLLGGGGGSVPSSASGPSPVSASALAEHVGLDLLHLQLGELRVDRDDAAALLTLLELGKEMENPLAARPPLQTVPVPVHFSVRLLADPTDSQVSILLAFKAPSWCQETAGKHVTKQGMLRGGVLVAHPTAGEIPIYFMLAKIRVLTAVQGVPPEERHAEKTAPLVLPPRELVSFIGGIEGNAEFTSKMSVTFTPDNPKLPELLR
eukprot:191382-Amphidinium_carterae.3